MNDWSIKKLENTKGRNVGIDFLRIIAMFYVVILHTLGVGGVLDSTVADSMQYKGAWFVETWAYCAVNIFGMISGYVGYRNESKKYNYSSYFVTWLQVVFYGVLITLIFNCFHPEHVTKIDLVKMFFPLTNGWYWYFTAYTGLFFLIPFLNEGIRKCSDQYLKKLLIVIFVVFTMFDRLIDRFVLSKGYSVIWLIILYIIGAIIKKCDIGKKMKIRHVFLGIIVCCGFCWAWKIYGREFQLGRISVTKDFFLIYTSPGILGAAVLHVIGFSKIKFHKIVQKMIDFAAPGAFAVYLINCQIFVWEYFMRGRFTSLANEKTYILVLGVLCFAGIFVGIAVVIDRVRAWLFDLFQVKRIAKKIEGIIGKMINWCAEKM